MHISPVCVYLLLLVNFAYSGRVMRKMKEYVHRAQHQRAKEHLLMRATSGKAHVNDIKEGVIHQPLDHFAGQSSETFPQRYFINEEHWDRPNGPVFLYIGGEAAISTYSVMAGHHVAMAEEHRALLVALEHRFYGTSINPDGLQTKKLSYLRSQNNLADLVAFHQFISQTYGLSHKNTWISFGGSYPGSLSAWFRGKFPHLIYGAVASSAPIKAKLDFSTYNKVVGESLMNEAVGGSEKCLGTVREAFAAVEAKLLGAIRRRLCTIITNASEAFKQEEEAYDRLVKLVKIYQDRAGESCLQTSFAQSVQELNDTTVKPSGVGERQWLYQTCTEFGYYQTCENASCPFSRMLTLQAQTVLCPLLFGVSQSSLASNVAFTNKYYGGDHPLTHRVLYVNGDIDPWHALSMLRNGTAKADKDRAILIGGTAHCADMSSARSGDPPTLTEARREIEMHVASWLKSATWEHL
ncbi:hypothetical protein ANANG_G00238230 [Anguilla anguilla]|uniref:Thymus-specific serine protease n=1 Tax=Anguilla anguilla TaxID=7936 RepID=A0A9D3LX12_ANGAN|nr:hypothetical protein ANANG_G00238230 [Anguilla anguilla]